MQTITLKQRVTALEEEVAALKRQLGKGAQSDVPWWEKIAGTFENDPAFEEAMRLGREYRESLRPRRRRKANGRSRHRSS